MEEDSREATQNINPTKIIIIMYTIVCVYLLPF